MLSTPTCRGKKSASRREIIRRGVPNGSSVNRREFIKVSSLAVGGMWITGDVGADAEVQVCPKSHRPARVLFAFRLEELPSYGWDMRLTLTCLQGVVNRSQPQLYLIHDRYDELWLSWLRERGDVDRVEWLELGSVFERFLPETSCIFVTDPAIPASVNVATMLAGVHGGLVATPATADQYDLPKGEYPDSPEEGLDLRHMHWKKDVDAYRWAYQKLGSSLSRQVTAILDPSDIALRDYLVEFKIPILWISGPRDAKNNPQASFEEEKEFARDILMKWPPNIPCLGWPGTIPNTPGIGESEGVDLASECAKFEVCTAYDGYSPAVGNLSVHSGTTATLRQQVPPIRLQRNKVHFAFIRTDGDGPNFVRHYYRMLFDDPEHGEVPLGWQLGPTACDLMPDIVDYYYKHARPGDCFVNALTGVGYIHEDKYGANYPPQRRQQILRNFMKLSALYRQKIDATTLCTYSEMSATFLELFSTKCGFKGIFANYTRSHETTVENEVTTVAGVPVFRAANGSASWLFRNLDYSPYARRKTEFLMIDEIKRWTPRQRPAFLYVSLANWLQEMGMATNIARGLGPEYVAVRPDQLVALYSQARGGQAMPGDRTPPLRNS